MNLKLLIRIVGLYQSLIAQARSAWPSGVMDLSNSLSPTNLKKSAPSLQVKGPISPLLLLPLHI